MKKIIAILILSCLLVIVSFFFVSANLKYTKIKKENINLQQTFIGTEFNNELEEKNSITLKDELDGLKEKLKKEINEYNLWIKTKEKLTFIISS